MQDLFSPSKWTATQKLTVSFLVVILTGSFLLWLPISNQPGTHQTYLDHLFTAVSMVCVTGLTVLSIKDTYTVFGQIVGIVLMQIGGLGLITLISVSLFYLKRRISLKDQTTLQMALNRNTNDNYKDFLFNAYRFTFAVEAIGALVLMTDFIPRYGWAKGAFNAVFVAVSAFCNAGFDNLGSNSLQDFVLNPTVNFTVALLIIAGGIGFTVWAELSERLNQYFHSRPRLLRLSFRRLSSHSRLALIATATLLFGGALITWLSELRHGSTIGNYNIFQQWMISFFQSAAFRTAGFSTLNYEATHPFTNLVYMILMLIGGAPGGTAGGIKVTTAAIMFLLFRSELKGHTEVTFHKRVIPASAVKQAMTIILFFFTVLMIGYSLLLLEHPNLNPYHLLFEAISAMATVGSSAGITSQLTTWGRIIIMGMMFLGRVGPFTVFLSLLQRDRKEIHYADTDVLIG